MALNTQLSTTGRNACLSGGLLAALAGGHMHIRSGSQPATGDTALTGTKLVDIPLATPAGVVSNGALTLADPSPQTPAAGGTAGYVVLLEADNTTVLAMGSVGVSGCNLNLSSITIDVLVPVDLGSFVFTLLASVTGQ